MSDAMFKQEYLADFVNFTGAIYGDLIPPQILHSDSEVRKVIPEWPNIESWRQCLVGLDTGADHPFGAVKLISAEKGLVAVAEYLEKDRSFVQHSTDLHRLVGSNQVKWAINKNERQSMIELTRHGITCQPAENDQLAGTERVKTWLHSKQLWFVESRVPKTIQQMMALRYAEPRKDGQHRDAPAVYKKNDELPDCIRYAVMTFPFLPQPVTKSVERDISNLPADMQFTIERLRRIDNPERYEEPTIVGDFWT